MNAQNIRDYNFTLAANATQNLDVPGDYLKVISATGAIRVRTVEGWMKDLLPGQGVKGLDFQRLILEDRSGAANVGTIAVGIGADSIVDDRVTGDVSVIDTVNQACQYITGGTTAITAFNAQQLVAPTPGIAPVIRHAIITGNPGAGGSINGNLVAALTAPTSFGAALNQVQLIGYANTVSGTQTSVQLTDSRRKLPSGWGVWYLHSNLVSIAIVNSIGVSVELVP